GLVLQGGDVAHDLLRQAAGRSRAGTVGVVPAELVVADGGDRLVLGHRLGLGGHRDPSWMDSGMVVVHPCAPRASVDRRWTWTSSTLEKARVSASHHSGAASAMDCTGQCPWHSCRVRPPGPGRTEVA